MNRYFINDNGETIDMGYDPKTDSYSGRGLTDTKAIIPHSNTNKFNPSPNQNKSRFNITPRRFAKGAAIAGGLAAAGYGAKKLYDKYHSKDTYENYNDVLDEFIEDGITIEDMVDESSYSDKKRILKGIKARGEHMKNNPGLYYRAERLKNRINSVGQIVKLGAAGALAYKAYQKRKEKGESTKESLTLNDFVNSIY